MLSDYDLQQLLKENGYKITENNLRILKEGLENQHYEIFDIRDIVTEMIVNDNFDADYLCELFKENDLTDQDIDSIETIFEELDTDENDEILTESIISRITRMARGAARGVKHTGIRIKDAWKTSREADKAQDTYRNNQAIAKDTYKDDVHKAKQGYKDIKGDVKKAAIEKWKALSKENKEKRKAAIKAAKDSRKTAVRAEDSFDSSGKKVKVYKIGDATFASKKGAKAEAKEQSKAAIKQAKTDYKNPAEGSKKEYTGKVIDDLKAAKAQKIETAKQKRAKSEAEARNERIKAAGYSNPLSESFSDYKLYQILENNSFKTTENNLRILKEGLESGKYQITEALEIKKINNT